jgi:ADP-ribosylglycohydrolase
MTKDRIERVVGSATWAAYGDAIGFISELTDDNGLARRTKGHELDYPMAWTRRIGGRQGIQVGLPPGCYSDDTQLRLAVGRSIGPGGFDVEAFAKIELTVWPSYALGGGKGTKAAAANLCKENVPWYANTFKGWTQAGGNGAAMRIQPHVWSAKHLGDEESYIPDVIRDALCTHGSPTGILGAVLHSMFLAHAIERGDLPGPDEALDILKLSRLAGLALSHDADVDGIWMGLWQRETQIPFSQGWELAIEEAEAAMQQTVKWSRTSERNYHDLLSSLNLYSPDHRGSGLLTSIVSLGLLWSEPDVERALIKSANELGSDTDTIGTMAGALAGAVTSSFPKHTLMDLDLIQSEAERLARLAQGDLKVGHRYPDLLHWVPPRTQADAIVLQGGEIHLLGLGVVRPSEKGVIRNGAFGWQWFVTSYGQTLLAKLRDELREIPESKSVMRETDTDHDDRVSRSIMSNAVQPTLLGDDYTVHEPSGPTFRDVGRERRPLDRGVNLDDVLRWLDSGRINEDQAIGYVLRRVARDGSAEQLLILIGALRERLRS